MTSDNPYEPSAAMGAEQDPIPESISDGRAAYNVVSDTVTGLNVRVSDNKFQAIFILVAVLLFAAAGAVLALLNGAWELPWYGGALIGAFAGLVIGFFASGTFLMIYRAIRHVKGKHE